MCTYHVTALIFLLRVEVLLTNGLKGIVKGTILISADDLPANMNETVQWKI